MSEIVSYFKEHRIIVLVDDLDRASPTVVPEVLYGLREILDLPSFAFVLGFDRERVGAALAKHHPGWGAGLEFLDKILDFQRWVPLPSRDELLALVERDRARYVSFIGPEVLRRMIHVLPRNPRALRRFVRGLWCLEHEAARYQREELNWDLLALAALFRTQWPEVADRVFQQESIRKWLSSDGLSSTDEEERSRQIGELLADALEQADVSESDKGRAIAVLAEIRKASRWADERGIVGAAYFSERPAVLTGLECLGLKSSWNERSGRRDLSDWISRHSMRVGYAEVEVWDSLWEWALDGYFNGLGRVADAKTDKGMHLRLEEIRLDWTLLELLWSEGLVGERPTATHLNSLVGKVVRWAHFKNHPEYVLLRGRERAFLERAMLAPGVDPVSVWREIGTRNPLAEAEHAEGRQIIQEVEAFFVPRVVDRIFDVFSDIRETELLLYDSGRRFERDFLLDWNGGFWSEDSVQRFGALMKEAETASMTQECAVSFFMAALKEMRGGRDALSGVALKVLELAWSGAVAQRLNPRMGGTLDGLAKKVLVDYGVELKVPPWWPEVVRR
ncbi:P-loop NTPase fold protein [Myxococcus fulvus]|uniref:P-loop NTPase fold protein n=1 Tax=Myxococcus fulvus TaxID=33 RepID=UPI0020BE3258|nr:P-loop NTPase fold protein [Myxococcus fulvus]MCK8498615.1 KAP family NTPase [Myxococcus fulvus]